MKIPYNLHSAFKQIDKIVKPKERELIKSKSEKELTALTHHGLGRWIRNNWGLWQGEGDMYEYMIELGLKHPDDMSGLILTSYIRHVKGEDLNVVGEVERYREYWKKAGSPSHGMKVD
jgi:hypothetical protein